MLNLALMAIAVYHRSSFDWLKAIQQRIISSNKEAFAAYGLGVMAVVWVIYMIDGVAL